MSELWLTLRCSEHDVDLVETEDGPPFMVEGKAWREGVGKIKAWQLDLSDMVCPVADARMDEEGLEYPACVNEWVWEVVK